MDRRKEQILSAIIREYVDTALPVGSVNLVKRYRLKLSPATIRNEMAELEKEGYIYQPFTSAGRVPTDRGYRYFVDLLMEEKALTEREQKLLQTELAKLKAKCSRLARTIVKLLACMSQNLAVTGFKDSESVWDSGMSELLKQPEFRNIDSLSQVVTILDYINENIDKISTQTDEKVDIYIGEENPLAKIKHCSMIISGFKLPTGEKGIITIIGPKRMRYARNVSLINCITKFLGSGLIMILVIWG